MTRHYITALAGVAALLSGMLGGAKAEDASAPSPFVDTGRTVLHIALPECTQEARVSFPTFCSGGGPQDVTARSLPWNNGEIPLFGPDGADIRPDKRVYAFQGEKGFYRQTYAALPVPEAGVGVPSVEGVKKDYRDAAAAFAQTKGFSLTGVDAFAMTLSYGKTADGSYQPAVVQVGYATLAKDKGDHLLNLQLDGLNGGNRPKWGLPAGHYTQNGTFVAVRYAVWNPADRSWSDVCVMTGGLSADLMGAIHRSTEASVGALRPVAEGVAASYPYHRDPFR